MRPPCLPVNSVAHGNRLGHENDPLVYQWLGNYLIPYHNNFHLLRKWIVKQLDIFVCSSPQSIVHCISVLILKWLRFTATQQGELFLSNYRGKKNIFKPGPLKMRVVSCRDKCKVVFQLETDLFTTQYLNFTNVYFIFVRTTMFGNYKDLSFSG